MTNVFETGEEDGAITFADASIAMRNLIHSAIERQGGCAFLSEEHSPPDKLLAIFREAGSDKPSFGLLRFGASLPWNASSGNNPIGKIGERTMRGIGISSAGSRTGNPSALSTEVPETQSGIAPVRIVWSSTGRFQGSMPCRNDCYYLRKHLLSVQASLHGSSPCPR
jgi:hypothetical protein